MFGRVVRVLTSPLYFRSSAASGLKAALSRQNSTATTNGGGGATTTVLGVDQDGANWALESDTHSSFLRFSFVYLDINKIPRNHLR